MYGFTGSKNPTSITWSFYLDGVRKFTDTYGADPYLSMSYHLDFSSRGNHVVTVKMTKPSQAQRSITFKAC